jgi:hypothetical protein
VLNTSQDIHLSAGLRGVLLKGFTIRFIFNETQDTSFYVLMVIAIRVVINQTEPTLNAPITFLCIPSISDLIQTQLRFTHCIQNVHLVSIMPNMHDYLSAIRLHPH